MICGCVDNSSPDRYVLLHIGYSFPIRFLVLPVYLRNNVQYHSASVEGASYLRGIHKVQRYVIRDRNGVLFSCTFMYKLSLLFAAYGCVVYMLYSCGRVESIVLWTMVHLEMWCRSYSVQSDAPMVCYGSCMYPSVLNGMNFNVSEITQILDW